MLSSCSSCNVLRPPAFRACFKFLCLLDEQLLKPNMLLRAQYPNGLNRSTKDAMKIFDIEAKEFNILMNHLENDVANYVLEKWTEM